MPSPIKAKITVAYVSILNGYAAGYAIAEFKSLHGDAHGLTPASCLARPPRRYDFGPLKH